MGALTTLPSSETIPTISIQRLNPRQRKVLACLAEGKTLEQTGKELGVSRQRIWEMLESIKGRATELMDEYGITEAALIQNYLLPALNAEETEFAKFQGAITDSRNVVAWGPRLQALELAARIRGMVGTESKTVHANISIAIENIGTVTK